VSHDINLSPKVKKSKIPLIFWIPLNFGFALTLTFDLIKIEASNLNETARSDKLYNRYAGLKIQN
jgi:hypothetical protein